MKKPWSISTTVRNPERLRDFLRVLKKLEGLDFDEVNQIRYQVLLIQECLYKPQYIPSEFINYYEEPESFIPYEIAEKIFNAQVYEDPPMRGRQSVNPLNKLGFSIARAGLGPIKITELGNKFLEEEYDIGYIFFKSLFKIQFPNPWSEDFSERNGFNIMPFIAVMHLISKLNKKTNKKGLDKIEFCIFIPTLINFSQIDKYVEKILQFRKETDKNSYILNFLKDFYETKNLPDKKIKNLYDYGDNIMRYFRFTRYFRVSIDPLKYYWNINLEPSRETEIEQLLSMYNGEAFKFKNLDEYLNYLSDIIKPELPWENIENLKKIALSLKNITFNLINLIKKENIQISNEKQEVLITDIDKLEKKGDIEMFINKARNYNLELKEQLKKINLLHDLNKINEIISILQDFKKLKNFEPEQFEKLIAEALKIINDEISIKPNYPKDDEGEPISHSPGNKPDIECYYPTFKAICEVTLNTSKLQWVQEGQPVMRHLRDFENQYKDNNIFCIFIAPRIHKDTYSQFWISVKYEYNGQPQKIIPITTVQFSILLETLIILLKQGKRLSHHRLYELYSLIINNTSKLSKFSDWVTFIDKNLEEYQQKWLKNEN